MMWWMVLAACGGSEPPLASTPVPAHKELVAEAKEQEITWSALEGLFADGQAMPVPLAGLTPGMPGLEVRDIYEKARQPGMRLRTVEPPGHTVISGGLAGFPLVTVSFILESTGGTLEQVDLSLPTDQSLPALGARWGQPEETTTSEISGEMLYRWSLADSPWQAELTAVGEGRSVLKFQADAP